MTTSTQASSYQRLREHLVYLLAYAASRKVHSIKAHSNRQQIIPPSRPDAALGT